jgi:uncharacterized protein
MKATEAEGTEVAVERFEISSPEGLPIRGIIERPSRARSLALILHGFKGFKEWGFFPWLAERLHQSRIATCRFDFSRSGITEGSETFDRLDLFADDTYSRQLNDLNAVVHHLARQPALAELPLTVFGHSRGGAIALLGAARIPRLHSVVVWSSIASLNRWDEPTQAEWRRRGSLEIVNQRTGQVMALSTAILDDLEANRTRLDLPAAIATLDVPLLVIHGGSDESVDIADGRLIARSAPNATLVVIERASHTFGAIHPLVHVPRQLEVAATITARFISDV